jgi:hypothetical protein
LAVNCVCEVRVLAVNRRFRPRRQSYIGLAVNCVREVRVVFLLLQLKDATIGNLRYSRSDLLDPFSPYLPNKDLASTIAHNDLCVNVLQ